MKSVMVELIENTPGVMQQVRNLVPKHFPSQIADSILQGLRRQASELKTELRQN